MRVDALADKSELSRRGMTPVGSLRNRKQNSWHTTCVGLVAWTVLSCSHPMWSHHRITWHFSSGTDGSMTSVEKSMLYVMMQDGYREQLETRNDPAIKLWASSTSMSNTSVGSCASTPTTSCV